jgi:hypothetical protein
LALSFQRELFALIIDSPATICEFFALYIKVFKQALMFGKLYKFLFGTGTSCSYPGFFILQPAISITSFRYAASYFASLCRSGQSALQNCVGLARAHSAWGLPSASAPLGLPQGWRDSVRRLLPRSRPLLLALPHGYSHGKKAKARCDA